MDKEQRPLTVTTQVSRECQDEYLNIRLLQIASIWRLNSSTEVKVPNFFVSTFSRVIRETLYRSLMN